MEKQNAAAAEALVSAVQALSYPEDREDLLLVAQTSKTERAACLATRKLACPEEAEVMRALILDAKRPKSVRQAAARALPEDDAILDKLCCPRCGAIGTVHRFSTYSQMDDANTEGYRCSACKNSNTRYQFDCNLEQWTVPLRTFLGL